MNKHLALYLKGVAMGIADLVPGVSGGTIALISGIYYKLITSLAKIDLAFFSKMLRFKFASLQKDYDILFFIVLGTGILSGIAGGASLVHYALDNYSPVIYSLFAGMIIASAISLIDRTILKALAMWVGIILGFLLIFGIQVNLPWTPLAIFFAGGLAICAMLLPGISGSLILVLLGLYEPIINALIALDIFHISFFIAGALTTLFGFSRLILLSLQNYKKQTEGFIAGLMLGVLPKLWPWQSSEYSLELMSPVAYSTHGTSSYIVGVIIAFIAGLAMIFALQKIRHRPQKN